MSKREIELSRISRFLTLILRHKPEQIGLELSKDGWADIGFLLDKLKITKDELDWIVDSNNKKRFHYSDDKAFIRAAQGHSKELKIDIDMKDYIPSIESQFLYHGTSKESLQSIFKAGLKPMTRQHVHLSKDIETAIVVGKRRKGDVVILKIQARAMYTNGLKFKESENGVVLCDFISPEYILEAMEI